MPLFRDFSDDQTTIQIWKFDEYEVLDPKELLEPENLEKIKDYHPKKLAEHLMIRRILKNHLHFITKMLLFFFVIFENIFTFIINMAIRWFI